MSFNCLKSLRVFLHLILKLSKPAPYIVFQLLLSVYLSKTLCNLSFKILFQTNSFKERIFFIHILNLARVQINFADLSFFINCLFIIKIGRK